MTSPRVNALGHSQSLSGIHRQCYMGAVRGSSRATPVTPASPELLLSAKTVPSSEAADAGLAEPSAFPGFSSNRDGRRQSSP